jgi:hypothetical protein
LGEFWIKGFGWGIKISGKRIGLGGKVVVGDEGFGVGEVIGSLVEVVFPFGWGDVDPADAFAEG